MNELVEKSQALHPLLERNFTRTLLDSLRRLLRAIDQRFERRRQRLALLALSDHMLKDIGLSRTDAIQEGTKPFWRV